MPRYQYEGEARRYRVLEKSRHEFHGSHESVRIPPYWADLIHEMRGDPFLFPKETFSCGAEDRRQGQLQTKL